MKYQWLNKNVDLKILHNGIKRFFESLNFRVHIRQSNELFELRAIKRVNSAIRRITVKLHGNPNKFTVEFLAGEQARSIQRMDMSLELLGGGVFVLKARETLEYYQKIEDGFWRYMEALVAQSVNSANSASNS